MLLLYLAATPRTLANHSSTLPRTNYTQLARTYTWDLTFSTQAHPDCVRDYHLRTLGLALGVPFVPVTRALVLVPISSRRHTLALFTAYSTVLQAPVLYASVCAPRIALLGTESYTTRNHQHDEYFEK
jgi:hypothetical protein